MCALGLYNRFAVSKGFVGSCRNLSLPISIQDDKKLQKYVDTYNVSHNIMITMHTVPYPCTYNSTTVTIQNTYHAIIYCHTHTILLPYETHPSPPPVPRSRVSQPSVGYPRPTQPDLQALPLRFPLLQQWHRAALSRQAPPLY